MKVVHIEAGRHLYGGAEQVRCLMAGLSVAGIDNVLVCPRGAELARYARAAGADEVVEMDIGGELDLSLAARLRRELDRLRPDLVHVHSRRGADLHGGRACASGGHPAVVTRRVQSWEPASWLRWKYRPYAAVIAISRAIESDLLARVGLDPTRVRCVWSAVDGARFAPAAEARARLVTTFGLEPHALIVGVVAQLVQRKGHDVLLEALPELARRYPRLRVLCFGRGPLEQRLRRRIGARGLAPYVHLTGFRDDLPALLGGLDALAHPARREGLGVALLEAMSAGVPVVASAVGGIPDVVQDGVHGLLVPPGDAAALGAALERLLGDAGLRARLAAAAAKRAQTRFSVAAMAAGNVEVYRSVLDAAGAGTHAALKRGSSSSAVTGRLKR